jgi:hypothetical protein
LVHGEIRGGEYREGGIEGLAMEVRVFVMLRIMLCVTVFQQQYANGGGNTCEFKSLTFEGENPRSGLN